HLFYHRWAVLRSTKHESVRVFRGYLKVDISISFRGQIPKLPINVQNNDIDGNLLVQEEGILERQTALFIFDIYKCINLTYKPSNKINVPKKKCKGVECGPNSFIRVYFAAQSVKTRHFFNNKNPAINQRLILRDTYPTVAQRIKLEVHYSDDRTHLPHASYNVNLKYISNASEDGFLPLFGPTFVHLYTKKNMQGYAGSVLMEMKTEIKDIMLVDAAMKQREIPRELYEKSYVKEIENLLQEKDYVGVENIVDESLQYLATAAVKYLDIIQRYNLEEGTKLEQDVIIQILSERTLKSESISEEVKNPREERINPIGFLKDRVGSFIGAIREIRKQSKSSEKTPTKPKRLSVLLTREETDYVDTDDFDWWTKFYASEKEKPKDITQYIVPVMERIKLKIYPNELEKQPEFKGFTDTLFPFEIFKGRRTGDHALDDTKITGVFKGNIKVYRWPPEEGNADCVTASGVNVNDGGIFQDLPRNLPLKFVARIYVVQALNLRPKDVLGTADPYIRVIFNKEVVEDKQIYIANKSNPIFGRCFEFQGTFPEDNTVTIEVWDWDRLSKDDLIGKTVIDIENRFYTKYRACCGISEVYQK
ncbi:unnamed protein product, partial [Brassicogethes aeneus]